MNNFDDLFDAQGSQPYPGGQPFDKDAWAEKKKAERQSVFDLADSTAGAVCTDGGKFREYGIDASGYDFSRLPDSSRESDPQNVCAALSEIRDTAGEISGRMARVLEQRKQPKSKEQGR